MSQYRLVSEGSDERSGLEILSEDPSKGTDNAGSFSSEFQLSLEQMNDAFFAQHDIEYVPAFFANNNLGFRVLTHPKASRTCFEKAALLGNWRALNVIKALYLEDANTGDLYGIVVPETGCFIDRERLSHAIDSSGDVSLRKAQHLPDGMVAGTCSPFLTPAHLIENGGSVRKLYFDTETLVAKKHDRSLDDFSFGSESECSVQFNYYHCYKMLKQRYPTVIAIDEVLGLSFHEVFVRKRGQVRVTYDFKSLNYRVASFLENNHGYGDVSIENDFFDEIDLPDSLVR